MNRSPALERELGHLQQRALIVGLLGLALCLLGAFLSGAQFFRSYLFAYLFWIGLALGCSGILMVHHLFGTGWGVPIRRLMESGAMTLPLMALLFLPLLFGLRDLYLWARPEIVATDELLQAKSIYLNVPGFLSRTLIYFLIWIFLAYFLNHWSAAEDREGRAASSRWLQLTSRVGLMLYVLTASFAAIDWAMSLEPHWYSSIYGLLFIVGQGLTALAFAAVLLGLLGRHEPLGRALTAKRLRDLGNLLIVFILITLYFSFSQYLVIWAANLPRESLWYLRRGEGGWQWLGLFLFLFYFALPFLLLFAGLARGSRRLLAATGLIILLVRLVDMFWFVTPAFSGGNFRLHWLDLVAPVAIGGLWLAMFTWWLRRRPLLPLHDPNLEGSNDG